MNVEDHMPMVRGCARELFHTSCGLSLDDLVSEGLVGLLQAAARYDSNRNNSFATFARWRVKGAMRDAMEAWDFRNRKARRDGVVCEFDSFDEVEVPGEEAKALAGLLSGERVEMLYEAMKTISAQQAKVIRLLYEEEMSREEVAAHLGVTFKTVATYHFNAIQRLRSVIGTYQ